MRYFKRFKTITLITIFVFTFQVSGLASLALAFSSSQEVAQVSDPIPRLINTFKDVEGILKTLKEDVSYNRTPEETVNKLGLKALEIIDLKIKIEKDLAETEKKLKALVDNGEVPYDALQRHLDHRGNSKRA